VRAVSGGASVKALAQRSREVVLKDGSRALLRVLRRDDLERLVDFFLNIGPETEKYFHPFPFTREQAEKIIAELDYERFFPVVALSGEERIVGIAYLTPFRSGEAASLGIGLRQDYRGRGLGTHLMKFIIDLARERGVSEIRLSVYADNCRAIALYCKFGFEVYEVRKRAVFLRWDGRYHTVYLMSLELGPESGARR